MVYLDHQLLSVANRLVNGANVHGVKELIFAYEQAVELHNRHNPGHEVYRIQCEARLRIYVRRSQQEDIEQKTRAAIERANIASNKSNALSDSYDRLEKSLEEWTGRFNGESNRVA